MVGGDQGNRITKKLGFRSDLTAFDVPEICKWVDYVFFEALSVHIKRL